LCKYIGKGINLDGIPLQTLSLEPVSKTVLNKNRDFMAGEENKKRRKKPANSKSYGVAGS